MNTALDQKRVGLAVKPGFALSEISVGLGWAVILALFVPFLVDAYFLKTLLSTCIMGLACMSVAVIYAQLGMVSLCQYALVGVGGWVTLRIWHGTHLPFEVAMLGGGIAAGLFGLIAGLPALRMRGLYLALITLMIAGAIQIFLGALGFPDGGPGFSGRITSGARVFMTRPALAESDEAYFRYCVVVVAIGFYIVRWHRRSRAGRAWAQIRRSEACALSAGVNLVAYKMWAFTLAGFLAGIAGALSAGVVGQLDGRAFTAFDSIMLFALTVIAGAYHWSGPIFAGVLRSMVPAALNYFGIDGNILTMIFGAGLLHALITAPTGISGEILSLGRVIGRRFFRKKISP
jgi:branched-chain amino acid transport system permease protein